MVLEISLSFDSSDIRGYDWIFWELAKVNSRFKYNKEFYEGSGLLRLCLFTTSYGATFPFVMHS
jgi:hypothetical protein